MKHSPVAMVTGKTNSRRELSVMDVNALSVISATESSLTEDELTSQGLFIDDIHRLRILDPSLADQTLKLKSECDHFLQSIL